MLYCDEYDKDCSEVTLKNVTMVVVIVVCIVLYVQMEDFVRSDFYAKGNKY